MIQGRLAGDDRPYVKIVIGWRQGVQELLVLVDTGFNGELKMPEKTMSELGLTVTHVTSVMLADGTGKNMPASLAFVSLEDAMQEVNVIISESIPTIGVKLLKEFRYKLTVDFNSRTVFLEKM